MSLVLALIDDGLLPGIGDAVRTKTGKTEPILPDNLRSEVLSISDGVSLPEQIDHITGGTFTPAAAITTYIDIDVDITWTPKIFLMWTEDAVVGGTTSGRVAGITILKDGMSYSNNYSAAIVVNSSGTPTRLSWGYAVGVYYADDCAVRVFGNSEPLAAGWKYNWLLIG